MASHHLAIAKASLVAACIRPDVTQIGRDDVNHFHALLEASLLQCSASNIQNCKKWLLDHILPSLQRTTALGKYFGSVCQHIQPNRSLSHGKKLTASRQQLHLLYVINDVFHHTRYHVADQRLHTNLEQGLNSVLPSIFSSIAASCKSRVKHRLQELAKIWDENKYLQAIVLQEVKVAIARGPSARPVDNASGIAPTQRELPYIMPASHGDPASPFYDLPAANLMPHIVPNKPIPIKSEQIRALQLGSGPADESLVRAVKDFLKDVDRLDNPYMGIEHTDFPTDMDEMGQMLHRNEDGDLVGDTYYGWSRGFCEKMRNRMQDNKTAARDRSQSAVRKRPRRGSSRSWSTSGGGTPHRARSRSRSYSPDEDRPRFGRGRSSPTIPPYSDRQVQGFQQPAGFIPPPLGPNNMPIPPPRPPNWNGPWPPPLPGFTAYHAPNMQFKPPPPPPPPYP